MKKIIQLFILSCIFLGGAISCKKETFNINSNPNQATDSTIVYNVILPAAENNTGRLVSRNWAWLQNYLGYWARSGTYAPNTTEETYELTSGFQAGIWTNVYDNLYDYQIMQISATKSGADFYAGIARIMKAHNFAMLVDIYNNVPYSESLKGAANTTPKYDKGVDIYKDLLRQIDTGMALVKNAVVGTTGPNKSIATDDIMFKGVASSWAKFGNTLKLRILTKFMNGGIAASADGTIGSTESFVPGVVLADEFAIITAEGSGFMTEDASVQPVYTADAGNPFYNLYVKDNAGNATANSVYYDANAYAIGYYNVNQDSRIAYFYTASPTGYRGVEYGLPSDAAFADATLSGIGTGLSGADATSAQRIVTAAESYFLQAECIHRGFLSGDAATAVNQGIYASFESLYTTAGDDAASADADAQAYIDGNAGFADVDYNAVEDINNAAPGGLVTIIQQKWFALNGLAPYEVWSDYRRIDFSSTIHHFVYGSVVGYDAGPPISVSPANTKTELPVRLFYPESEYLYNPANVGAEPPVGAYPYSHIFWDLN